MKIDTTGFRKDTEQLFTQFVLAVPTKNKQTAPFIVVGKDVIMKVSTVDDLLEYKDETEVLQTWPGKWRSDVFYFTVKDLKDHIKKGG